MASQLATRSGAIPIAFALCTRILLDACAKFEQQVVCTQDTLTGHIDMAMFNEINRATDEREIKVVVITWICCGTLCTITKTLSFFILASHDMDTMLCNIRGVYCLELIVFFSCVCGGGRLQNSPGLPVRFVANQTILL